MILDDIHLRNKSIPLKERFIHVERLLCDNRPSLVTRCDRPHINRGGRPYGPRLTPAQKTEAKRERDERRYAAVKMGGIGRGQFRKAGSDKKTQQEWCEWWRVKTRYSALMSRTACDLWLMERGMPTKLTWR